MKGVDLESETRTKQILPHSPCSGLQKLRGRNANQTGPGQFSTAAVECQLHSALFPSVLLLFLVKEKKKKRTWMTHTSLRSRHYPPPSPFFSSSAVLKTFFNDLSPF